MNYSKSKLLVIGFAIIYVVWGTTYLAMLIGLETLPPFALGALRFLIAGLGTYATLRIFGAAKPTAAHWQSAAIVGTLMMVGGNGLVMLSMKWGLASGIASVIVATMPLWMTLFDWLIYKGPRPSPKAIVGLTIGFIGIFMFFDPLNGVSNPAALDVTSCLVCLFAPVFWAIGSLHSRKLDLPENVFMAVALQMVCGGIAFLLICLATGELNSFHLQDVSIRSILGAGYLIVFGSIVALTTYMWLLKNAAASRVATYTYVNPVIAVFLGWIFMDEVITFKMWLAITLIITSVILVVSNQSNREVRESEKTNLAKCHSKKNAVSSCRQ